MYRKYLPVGQIYDTFFMREFLPVSEDQAYRRSFRIFTKKIWDGRVAFEGVLMDLQCDNLEKSEGNKIPGNKNLNKGLTKTNRCFTLILIRTFVP